MLRLLARPSVPVMGLLALGSAIYVAHVPLAPAGLLICAAATSVLLQGRSVPARTRRFVSVGIAIALAAVALSFLEWSSSVLITLLLGAAGWLKLAERDGPRDRFAAMLAGLFLVGLGLLRLPPDPALLVLGLSLACVIWALWCDQQGLDRSVPLGPPLRAWLGIAVPAAILTAILFVFTPRITGDLNMLAFAFDLPFVIETEAEKNREPQGNAMTLDDLGDSGDGDMRVLVAQFYKGTGYFEDGAPPLGDLYWRGPVMYTYTDQTWQGRPGFDRRAARMRSKLNKAKMDQQLRDIGMRTLYDMSVFPNRSEWLYALDLPAYAPASAYVTRDWQLMNLNPIREMLHYAMMSYIEFRAGEIDEETRALALQLPSGHDPATIEIGRRIAQEAGEDQVAMVRAGLAHFDHGFFYDRGAPRPDGLDQVDAFLTDTKRGGGMRFATAFTLMMRAAGIPTRLIVGYRGGLNIGLTDKVIVMQKDAHVWAEVWLDDYGWVRMDPAAASMARQRDGGDGWGLANGLSREITKIDEDDVDQPAGIDDDDDDSAQVQPSQQTAPPPDVPLEQVENGIHWLAEFDARMQGRFLQATGLRAAWGPLVLIGCLMGFLFLGGILLWSRISHVMQLRRRPLAEQWADRFCRDLARIGPRRRRHEPLRTYVARIRETPDMSKDLSDEITAIGAYICDALYGRKNGAKPCISKRFPQLGKRRPYFS